MKKLKALAWTALYVVIALGMQMGAGLAFVGAMYTILISNGLIRSSDAVMALYEQVQNIGTSGAGALTITAMYDLMVLAGFGLWYYFRENKYPFRPNYKAAFTAGNVGAIFGIAIFGQFAVELIMAGVSAAFPWMMKSYETVNEMLQMDTLPPALMILIVCIVGPLAEEMLFRGMIYGKLRRGFSIWPSAILSGLIFGVFHGNWIQGIYATLVGIILALVYEKTQTIWGSCLLHVLFNSSSYVLDYLTKLLDNFDSSIINLIRLLIDAVSVVIVIILTRHFCSRRQRQ